MTRTPGKRGSGRGGRKAAATADGAGKTRGKRNDSPHSSPNGGRKPSRPGWLPEPPPARAGGPRPAPQHDPHAEREAQRYEQPIASREMILAVLAASDGPMDADALAQR
ncbi:MAG TPA: ribonuclease R, partial [Xanthomonadaceae bacterium]|nr:ribonuclease R [Xanthomonadaceae bacterium]